MTMIRTLFLLGLPLGMVASNSPQDDGLLLHAQDWPIQGTWATNTTSRHSVRKFLGIPYAESPIGVYRFRPPVAKQQPVDIINATAFGHSCMQYVKAGARSFYRELLPDARVPPNMRDPVASDSEDCLTLNVWTPTLDSVGHHGQLPVLVWIHGGGYTAGGSAEPYFDGSRMVEKHNVVVVSLNYRVNIFGFPAAKAMNGEQLNLGLLDQRMAVEWVHAHIHDFGGDPGRIVLFGHSAGANSVDLYSYAWHDKPLVTGLIIMSGAAGARDFSVPGDGSNFTYVAEKLGCGGMEKHSELGCMQAVPAEDIIEIVNNYEANQNAGKSLSFVTVADEHTAFSNYTERRRLGMISRLPTLIGGVDNDYAGISFSDSAPDQAGLDRLGDEWFNCRGALSAKERSEMAIPVWRYRYFGVWPNMNPLPWLGSYHFSEVPMIFGTSDFSYGPNTPNQAEWSEYMQYAWVAFAKDPKHGLTNMGWPRYGVLGNTLARLGMANSTVPDFVASTSYDGGCGLNVISPAG